MPLTKQDLKQIKGVVEEVVVSATHPHFRAIQKDFQQVYKRFDRIDGRLDRIEKLILANHKRRIEKLEEEVKELKALLTV